MKASGRRPTCHPDKPHMAFGLCRACYARHWRATGEAHIRGNYGQTTPITYTPESFLPERIQGVRQSATDHFPMDDCPKCHSRVMVYQGREAHCAYGCGLSVWLVREAAPA